MAMVTLNRFRELIQRLTEKTKANRVEWDHDPQEESFNVEFGDGTNISVFSRTPPESGELVGAVLRAHYKIMAVLGAEKKSKDWKLLSRLHGEAMASIDSVDEEMDKVDRALDSDHIVRSHPQESEMNVPSEPPDKQKSPSMDDLTDGDSGFSAERDE